MDCAANANLRLNKVGIDQEDISDIIITHFHADHVSGLPNLLMDMWLLGRKKEVRIHGLQHAITRIMKMMELYDWDEWGGMYPVDFHVIPNEELSPVLDSGEFKILSSPVEHLIPTLGIRVEYPKEEFILAYSSDTNPIPETVRLADGADVLIHEAAGAVHGHSSPTQAGEIASQSKVKSLYLIHYGFHGGKTAESLIEEAKKTFPGNVYLAEDYLEIDMRGN
jgi:ribonuclease Z